MLPYHVVDEVAKDAWHATRRISVIVIHPHEEAEIGKEHPAVLVPDFNVAGGTEPHQGGDGDRQCAQAVIEFVFDISKAPVFEAYAVVVPAMKMTALSAGNSVKLDFV